ncbi:MAG: hypothetical protein FWG35_03080 [Spirochaetaceae bacterium]|nr:hypothetical protein [Spirochaetaceae bacterium]
MDQEDIPTLLPGQFWAQRMNGSWYIVDTEKLWESQYCEVYAEESQLGRINAVVNAEAKIAGEFDTIYPLITGKFGFPVNIFGNPKIIIILLDIQDGWNGWGSYVAGYFDPQHCLSGPFYRRSNHANMIFIDTYPGLNNNTTMSNLQITLAHELQHLVNFHQSFIIARRGQTDTWINEGLSSAAEYLYKGHITDKINAYKGDNGGDISRGVNFVSWAPSYAQDAFSSYAAVYLFFQWLRIQAGPTAAGDEGIWKTIFQQPSLTGYTNYQGVVNAAQGKGFGASWIEILENWFIANALCDASGIHGYKNDTVIGKLQGSWPSGAFSFGSNTTLYPGEGVYVKLKNVYVQPLNPAFIRYTPYTKETTNDYCLVFNTQATGRTGVNAPLPPSASVSPAGITAAQSLSRNLPAGGEPRPIDRVFRLPEGAR